MNQKGLAWGRGSNLKGLSIFLSCQVGLVTWVGLNFAALAEGKGHAEVPAVNFWSFNPHAPPIGIFIIDFVLFLGLLVFFARKPIRQAFYQRHQRIKAAVQEAAAAHKSAQERYQEYQAKLANVDLEANSHVDHGRKDGVALRQQILATTQEYAARLRKDAQVALAHEFEATKQQLQTELIKKVLLEAETELRQNLTAEAQTQLVEQAIRALKDQLSIFGSDISGFAPTKGASAGGAR